MSLPHGEKTGQNKQAGGASKASKKEQKAKDNMVKAWKNKNRLSEEQAHKNNLGELVQWLEGHTRRPRAPWCTKSGQDKQGSGCHRIKIS